MRFHDDVDGLRGLVLLVVAFHVGIPYPAGGFLGVDVFFVISGYLITGLLATEVERTGAVLVAPLVAGRVRRFLPLR